MKVICINTKELKCADGSIGRGTGLIKGRIYTSAYVAQSKYSDECYFIEELKSLRQCKRFKPIDENWIDTMLEGLISESESEKCQSF